MFRFLENISIVTKLVISFFIVVILFLGLSIYSLSQVNLMKDLFINLYKHPYTVTNTIRDIDINIISMHRYMKDIALASNTVEIKRAIFMVNQHEENVLDSFKTLEDRFLGDEKKVLSAKEAFLKWKPIRQEVILSMKRGDFKKAANITKKKGYKYINSLHQKMKLLTDFATKKALDYYLNVIKNAEEIYFVIIMSVISIMIIGLAILFLVARYIKKQLSFLQKGVLNFFKYLNKETNDVTLLSYDSKDEIGKISQTINTNITYTKNIIENEKKLQEEVNKHQLMIIELNKNLSSRVKEEVEKNIDKEKLLFQQSKMASMGEMIENIAHQWRQPLSVISTAAMGVKIKDELDELNKDSLNYSMDTINNSVQHLSQTITDFRNFFKVDKIKKEIVLINTFEKTFKLISSQFRTSSITVIKNIEDITLHEMENELIQVLINVLNNARDELLKKTEAKKIIFINATKKEKFVEICIKDNAGGIPTEIINKVFSSHFTTKQDSSGTGIGLYMSKMIVEEHMNGKIEVENCNFTYEDISYTGAQFKVILPLS